MLTEAGRKNMREITYRQAINEAMTEEMTRDHTVFYMAEWCYLDLWGTTDGLLEKFGEQRVRNTPICEDGIVGTAVGAALAGYHPVVNMMFSDFMLIASDELLNKAAKWRFAQGGKVKIPMVVRVPIGGYTGRGPEHSQCNESYIMRTPGLKIAIPSTPYDAKGLLKTAIRDNNPVVYFEHKVLMGRKGAVPEGDYTIPFGVADIKRKGRDVTVVATSYMVELALQAAEQLQKSRGLSLEVIDPRTLEPLDLDTILTSVRKTKHLVVVDEDTSRCGVGAEIGMLVMENAFDALASPVQRVCAANIPIPSRHLEKDILPSTASIVEAVEKIRP
jgi:pyruvate/2-oxoglutarate/acetoin dehydrogenase E1 component